MFPIRSIATTASAPGALPGRPPSRLPCIEDEETGCASAPAAGASLQRVSSNGSHSTMERLLPPLPRGARGAALREPLMARTGSRTAGRTVGLARKFADKLGRADARGAAASVLSRSTSVLRQWRSTMWASTGDGGAGDGDGSEFGLGPKATWWERRACATERLLLGQCHSLTLFEPYAKLLLDVKEAKALIGCDPGGKSDPYVHVHVNDVLHGSNRENAQWRNLEPHWDYRVEIPIYSPFTVVRVTVMDRDRVGSDDFMGFVELRVADLEPGGPAVGGWFELRARSMLLGKASHRFRRHRRMRDDTYNLQQEGESEVCHSVAANTSDVSLTSCPGLESPRASMRPGREESLTQLPGSPRRAFFNRKTIKSFMKRESSVESAACEPELPRIPVKQRSILSLPASMRCGRCFSRCSPSKECAGKACSDIPPKRTNMCSLPARVLSRSMRSSTSGNAGEIRMQLELRVEPAPEPTSCEDAFADMAPPMVSPPTSALQAQLPSELLMMLTAAFRPRSILQVCPDPEWRACCFPYPMFSDASSSREHESASMQDIKDFYGVCVDFKGLVFNNLVAPARAVCLFVISWREFSLSMLVLGYWCFVCLLPFFWLPSLPLALAFWVAVLRRRAFSNRLLLHEALAPLSPEGLAMLSEWNSSRKMSVWLRRLIKDRGGWVIRSEELEKFAQTVHKDGQPLLCFATLIAELNSGKHRWITWNAGLPKRCQKGHVMEYMGSGAFRPDDEGWRCAGIYTWRSENRPCPRGIRKGGLHFGVPHYRCSLCDITFCGTCAMGGRKSNFLLEVPISKFGLIAFERVMEVVHGYAEVVEDWRDVLRNALSLLGRIFEERHKDIALKIYAACATASAAIALVQLILWTQVLGSVLRLLWRCAWVASGALLLLQRSAPLRRALAARKARRDLVAIRNMRARGGLRRWSFFREEVG